MGRVDDVFQVGGFDLWSLDLLGEVGDGLGQRLAVRSRRVLLGLGLRLRLALVVGMGLGSVSGSGLDLGLVFGLGMECGRHSGFLGV